jgi:hypothetical protein
MYEYRHVTLPAEIAKLVPRHGQKHVPSFYQSRGRILLFFGNIMLSSAFLVLQIKDILRKIQFQLAFI